MTNPAKDQIAADLQKAKSAGSVRVERIRKIVQDAFSQAVTELKEGSGEIGSIAKGSTSTLIDTLKEQPKNTTSEVPAPVEVIIEVNDEPTSTRTAEIQDAADTVVEINPVQVDAAQPVISQTVASEGTDQQAPNPPASEGLLDLLKVLIERVTQAIRSGEASAKLKEQIRTVDAKLMDRYGERYVGFKQEFRQDLEKAKAWYDGKKAEAGSNGTPWVEQKQAEFELKMGEAGATVATKEQKIKQLLKELWQTVTKS